VTAVRHRHVRACTTVILTATAVAFTAGCASDKDKAPACPDVAVVTDASTVTRFAPGPGRDLLDVDLQAEIADLVTACKDKEKRDGRPVAKVAVAPVVVVSRGPANQNRTPRVQYFVSVVDGDQRILQKQIYDLAVDFTENRTRVVIRDDDPPIVVDIPNASGVARGYRILVGFQLTPDELTYNRSRGSGGVAPGTLTRSTGPIE
jgi:hypothetical protein